MKDFTIMKNSETRIAIIIFAVLFFIGFTVITAAQERSLSDQTLFQDFDQDGLSNEEEKLYGTDPEKSDTDGDSYSDGTEVRSGYNPLVPAPGDRIVDPNNTTTNTTTNLTTSVAKDFVDLVQKKSLTEDVDNEIAVEDLDTIVNKALDENLTFNDLPEIDTNAIIIKKQNYSDLSDEKQKEKRKGDALEYLTAISYITVTNLPTKISSPDDLDNFLQKVSIETVSVGLDDSSAKFLKSLAEKTASSLSELENIAVPEEFLGLHMNGLQLARYAASMEGDFDSIDSTDPLATLTILAKMQGLLSLGIELSTTIEGKLSGLGINIEELPLNL